MSEKFTEISDLSQQYVLQHREITVDKTKWLPILQRLNTEPHNAAQEE